MLFSFARHITILVVAVEVRWVWARFDQSFKDLIGVRERKKRRRSRIDMINRKLAVLRPTG